MSKFLRIISSIVSYSIIKTKFAFTKLGYGAMILTG